MDEAAAIVIFITAPTADKGEEIARLLVSEGIAACASIIPRIRSVYNWNGKICEDEEVLLLVKSRKSLFPAIRDRVKSVHSYDVPEIISLPISDGLPEYLDWLKNVTQLPRERTILPCKKRK
jgi:periplasmic divalent cation tolerance protein